MKPHIEQTVTDLKNTVNRLNGIISFLSDFGAGLEDPIFPVSVQVTSKPNGAAPIKATLKVRPNRPIISSARPGKLRPLANVDSVAKLAEPFNSAALMKLVPGMTVKGAQNCFTRLKIKGWIISSGFGLYKRTSEFPSHTSPASNSPAPADKIRPTVTRTDLEKKLADALKQRDHARENGRDTIVEIFQKEIDQLEKQLGV